MAWLRLNTNPYPSGMEESHLWRGCDGEQDENVLSVGEAPEPSEIRYEDVHVTFMLRLSQQSRTFRSDTINEGVGLGLGLGLALSGLIQSTKGLAAGLVGGSSVACISASIDQ